MTENPSEDLVSAPGAPGRIKRELYVGKVRSWSTWVRRSGSGHVEIHVVCGQDPSKGLDLLRFASLDVLIRFRDAIDEITKMATAYRKGADTISNQKLEALIEQARKYRMTPAEQEAQVRSFAYGNTHLENDSITREDIERAAESLSAERRNQVRP